MLIDIGDMTESMDFWIYCILIQYTKRGEHKLKGDVKYLKNIDIMFGTWATK